MILLGSTERKKNNAARIQADSTQI